MAEYDDKHTGATMAALQAKFSSLRPMVGTPTRRDREAAAINQPYAERRAVRSAMGNPAKPTKGAQINFSVTAMFKAQLHAGARARGMTAVEVFEAAVALYFKTHPVSREVQS